jgi:leucyl-tRNA synthetase
MSKSKHNVVTPDETIEAYGADALRLYEVFMGPLEDNAVWQTENMAGVRRFLERVWRLYFPEKETTPPSDNDTLDRLLHKTIQKVSEDLEAIHPNTAISAMMIFVNEATRLGGLNAEMKSVLARLIAPFAPHLAEEFWAALGHAESIAHAEWPTYDPARTREDTLELPVQINGKLRGVIQAPVGADQATVEALALADEQLARHLAGQQLVKVIHRTDRMLNLVVRS